MKIKILLLGATILPSLSMAQSNTSIGTCSASLPPVEAQRCNDPSYFVEYRAAADEAINADNDEATNEIYQDNQANNETVVGSAKENLSNFTQCQLDTCQAYFDTCTSAAIDDVSSRRFEKNSGFCIDQGENRFAVAKRMSQVAVRLNAQTKAITTIEEKARAIIARNKEILIPMLQNIAQLTSEWAGKGSHLIRETRDVDKSTVQ
jgi:hypothetical protein